MDTENRNSAPDTESHDEPDTEPVRGAGAAAGLRASDAEREAVADRIRAAAVEGRLTVAEAETRQADAYAAETREALVPLLADLPDHQLVPPAGAGQDRPPRRRGGPLTTAARRRLAVHAAIVGAFVVFLVTRWALDPAPFFWPVFPAFWLGMTVLVHYLLAARTDATTTTAPTTTTAV